MKKSELTENRPIDSKPYYDELSDSWYSCKEYKEPSSMCFSL